MASAVFKIQRRLKKIDSSNLFQGLVIAVILLSALLIGAKTHNLPQQAIDFLAFMDIGVTVFFVIELSIRFLAYPDKKKFFHSGWNIFDTVIVIGSLIPAGGSGVLLARLLRDRRVPLGAKAVALFEAQSPAFVRYAGRVVENARALADVSCPARKKIAT